MLAQKRGFQGIVAVAILMLLMLGSLMPDPLVIPAPKSVTKPEIQSTGGKLVNFLDQVQTYYNSYYSSMNYVASAPLLRGIIEYELGTSSSPMVYIGRNDHLFYAGENATAQSTGAIFRKAEILHFIDMTIILSRELERRGAKLVVALPPNAQSIDIDDLPFWSAAHPPLEYDFALDELRKHDIATVDLRAPMLEKAKTAKQNGVPLYRLTDTHWSNPGAVLAFNLVVEGAGHAKLKVNPEAVLGPVIRIQAGDLARFIGIERYLIDKDAPILPEPEGRWEKLDILRSPSFISVFDTYAYERKGAKDGERIFVLGDSFTWSFWRPLFQRSNAERIGWMHHGACGFDFADVVRFRPTLVILAPTERAMPCALSSGPAGLPRE